MLKIGLTGNIASGKSEVEKILKQKGYFVVDLDIVSHDFLENNEIIKTNVLKEFNTLDRKKIGQIVFSSNEKRKILDNIFHNELEKYILDLFKKDYNIIFISGALLYEANFQHLFDKIIFVDAPNEIRLERLIKRNNFDKKTAQERINCQNLNYKNKADFIIENNKDIQALKNQVNNILQILL